MHLVAVSADVSRRFLVLVSALAATGFAVLAVLVANGVPAIERADLATHASLRAYSVAHSGYLTAMKAITHLGDGVVILVVDTATFAVFLWLRRWRAAIFVATGGLGVWLLSRLTRYLMARPRPGDLLWHADGPAFPSGHTTNIAATAAILTIVCWPFLTHAGRITVGVAAVAVPLAVGFTRIAGGVHWLTDVVGGLLFSLAVVCAIAATYPPHASAATDHGP